jgi:hypothetical protein
VILRIGPNTPFGQAKGVRTIRLHSSAARKADCDKDSLAAERSLDRALKAAELLNLELDDLLVTTEQQK